MAMLLARSVILACLASLAACDNGAPPEATTETIGVATMLEDGTIMLTLRASDADGTIGDAVIPIHAGSAPYDDTLRHLGGLRPGETKPVPPWPESAE